MSRWGEEEKKSKGLVGCGFAVLLLGFTLFTFARNYRGIEDRRQMEKQMQQIVRSGYAKSEVQMISELNQAAEDIGMELHPDDLELTKSLDDYGNPVVDVYIDYSFEVDLIFTTFPINIPIQEEVVIVAL